MAQSAPVDLGQVNASNAQYDLLAPIEAQVNMALQLPEDVPLDQAAAGLTDARQWTGKELPLDDYTYLLFDVILAKVLAIPHAHPYQQRLMQLLRAIQSQPSPLGDEEPDFWVDLPGFWLIVSEVFNSEGLFESSTGPLPGERRMTTAQWTNLHSFLAGWHASEPAGSQPAPGRFRQALQLFSHVLERPRRPRTLAENLPAVAAWLTSEAGPRLHASCERSQALGGRDSTRLLRDPEPEFYTGPDGWSERRWDFWRGRLGELQAEEEELGAEACGEARRAYEAMETLEKGTA